MLKNILIQLFNEDGSFESERLVSQQTEFYTGPKDKWGGPVRVTLTLADKDDVSSAIEYLERLKADRPLRDPNKKVNKAVNTNLAVNNNHEQYLLEKISKANDNQDSLINLLRADEFMFLDSNQLLKKIPEKYEIKEIHLKKYQWLLKRDKTAKDPRNDKFDPQLLVGISIMEERKDKIVYYLYGEYGGAKRIKLPNKAYNISKTNLIKYPHYMIHDEREKWGIEHRLLLLNEDKKPSKFYMRWYKDITVGDELKITNIIERGK